MRDKSFHILLPASYEMESEMKQSQIITTNGMALILSFAALGAVVINAFHHDYQKVSLYIALILSFVGVIVLSHNRYEIPARIILAFLPGLSLFLSAIFTDGVIHGDRQGHFFALIITSTVPLILFSDSGERFYFGLGCLYYIALLLLFDHLLHFETSPVVVTTAIKLKELILYGAIAAGFAFKLNQKSKVESSLMEKNQVLTDRNNEIETLLEEVRVQKEELFIQQETLFVQNDQLLSQKNVLTSINGKLEKNNEALLELASNKILTSGNFDEALKVITAIASNTLQVSRVSVWQLSQDKSKIECLDLYSLLGGEHSCGMELKSVDYPVYFEAIKSNKAVVADEATLNRFTSEFNENYLFPLQIKSMLDAPFFIEGQLFGIVCFEHQEETRKWTHEDIIFCRAIADIVPLAHEASQRMKAQEQIRIQNDVLLAKQAEIVALNEQLEQKVAQRTSELQERNKVLEELAFFNAHVLRAPLCSLKGLLQIAKNDSDISTNEDYVQHLNKSLEEMEAVTFEISTKLDRFGKPLDN